MININLGEIQIKKNLINRVAPIIENFLTTDDLLVNLEQEDMIEEMVKILLRNYSVKELEGISDENLTTKIRRVLGIEVLSHLFDDLTAQEIVNYETTVKTIRNQS